MWKIYYLKCVSSFSLVYRPVEINRANPRFEFSRTRKIMAGDFKNKTKSFENFGAIIENVRDHLLVEFFVHFAIFVRTQRPVCLLSLIFIIGHPMFFRLLRCWMDMDGWMTQRNGWIVLAANRSLFCYCRRK